MGKTVGRFLSRNAARSQRRIVAMFLNRFVTLLRRRSAEMFQELTARRFLQDNVVQSPDNTASMFLTSAVTKFPRLNATTPTLSIVSRFLSKTAERSQEDIVSYFQASEPRRCPCRSVPSQAGQCVSLPLERFVEIFLQIVRFAMMYLRSGVITSRPQSPGTRTMKTVRAPPSGNVFQPPDRNVIPWWSRCPGRHTRPSVPPSMWRSVPLDMVIDLILLLHLSECNF